MELGDQWTIFNKKPWECFNVSTTKIYRNKYYCEQDINREFIKGAGMLIKVQLH